MPETESGRYVQAASIRTHYSDIGSGPAVLLLHGSGPRGSAATNRFPAIDELKDGFRVLAPDIVGFGEQ
jgi:2-hydroxymuconate-semialdehyde hydrolase